MKKEINANEALKEAMELNSLNYRDICYICNRPESTVFKWLNGTLTPDALAVLQIMTALKTAKMKMPRDIQRLAQRSLTKANYWAKKNQTNAQAYELVGDLLQKKTLASFFIFEGQPLSLPEIAEKTNKRYDVLHRKVKDLDEGVDVTDIIKNQQAAKRPGKHIKLKFKDQLISRAEISRLIGKSAQYVSQKTKHCKHGDDVTSLFTK